jgi:hypothetical protein
MSSSDSHRKIDVHAHYLPAGYADEMRKAGITHPDGMPDYAEWSPELALETYEQFGIATGILSISSPGVHYGDDAAARRLARKVNDAGAELVSKYPSRFGLFAVLPMPEVDGSLEEIAYALDVLHADGIGLKTNAHGIYLGDVKFDPIFQELNRRKTAAFIHPTSPSCWQQCAMGYPRPMLEFPFDTARAVTNLIFSGTRTMPGHINYSSAQRRRASNPSRPNHGNGQSAQAGFGGNERRDVLFAPAVL